VRANGPRPGDAGVDFRKRAPTPLSLSDGHAIGEMILDVYGPELAREEALDAIAHLRQPRVTEAGDPVRSFTTLCPDVLLHGGDRVSNRPNAVCFLVGDLNVERFFEHERQLDKGDRVGAEVVHKVRPGVELPIAGMKMTPNLWWLENHPGAAESTRSAAAIRS
jgi:hypothetical protein